jgi:hypothetical protein
MSDINFERQCAIRFCFGLLHSVTETLAKPQQAYGDCALSRPWFLGGLRNFKKELIRLKMEMLTESEILEVRSFV